MDNRLWVASRKGVFEIERGAEGWKIARLHFPAQNASMLMSDPRDGALYVALGHGHFGCKLHRSLDQGASWQEIKVPVYPPQPPDDTHEGAKKDVSWNLHMIWELTAGGKDEPGTLWCGTLPGGLFRSRDRGDSWELIESLWNDPRRKDKWMGGGADHPGIHSVCVNPADSRHVTIAVSTGGVWITKDGGETWTNEGKGMRAEYLPPEQAYDIATQDPHLLVQCAAAPQMLWVQHHNGIFRSTDGGDNWQEIMDVKPSVFGFAVAVHPNNPDTAWFVPAQKDEHRAPVDGQVVVTRTRDGGNSFEILRKGLPQEHAYDLVFRHALDVDETGNRLAFGSTTGSLWVSEDQGDTWMTVSEHLPPIYCVRFVKGR